MDWLPKTSKRLDRFNDLARGHNGARVVWQIDIQSGAHVLIRVARRRIFHHRDLITELGGMAHSSFHTCVGDESDDDQLVNTVLLEL